MPQHPAPSTLPSEEPVLDPARASGVSAQSTDNPSPETPQTPLAQADSTPEVKTADSASAPQTAPEKNGIAAKVFALLAATGPVAALIFLMAQLLPGMGRYGLAPEQARLANAIANFPGKGDGLFAHVSGLPAPDISPLYLWFMKGTMLLMQPLELSATAQFLGGSALCAALLILGLWSLGTLAAGGKQAGLAACAVFLSTFSLCGALHAALPDMFFATLTTFSLVFLYLGWVRSSAPLFLLTGFVLAALAAIAGGPAGLFLPLLTSMLFLFWRAAFRRAGALDGVIGFGVMLVLVLGWLTSLSLHEQIPDAITSLVDLYKSQWNQSPLKDAGVATTLFTWLPFVVLPWGIVALFLPWERFYRVPVHCWKNRTQDPGIGWIWCATLGALGTSVFFGPAFSVMILPLAVLASILVGRAVLHLSPGRSRFFLALMALFLGLTGIPLFCLSLFPGSMEWMPFMQDFLPECALKLIALPGMYLVGLSSLVFSALLLFLTNKRIPAGGLLVVLLLVTVAIQPINLLVLPHTLPLTENTPEQTAPAVSMEHSTPATAPSVPVPAESATPEASVTPETPVVSAPSAEPVNPALSAVSAPKEPQMNRMPQDAAPQPETPDPAPEKPVL